MIRHGTEFAWCTPRSRGRNCKPRTERVPGSENVTCAGCSPSSGIFGAVHCGAHGELAPARVSSHGLTYEEVTIVVR
jgi:hypothetical protein